jgi:hypothetical protein
MVSFGSPQTKPSGEEIAKGVAPPGLEASPAGRASSCFVNAVAASGHPRVPPAEVALAVA